MTDKQVMKITEQVIEATNKLIDYCNETGCKDCVFIKFKGIWNGCPIDMDMLSKLSDIVSNYKSKEE